MTDPWTHVAVLDNEVGRVLWLACQVLLDDVDGSVGVTDLGVNGGTAV